MFHVEHPSQLGAGGHVSRETSLRRSTPVPCQYWALRFNVSRGTSPPAGALNHHISTSRPLRITAITRSIHVPRETPGLKKRNARALRMKISVPIQRGGVDLTSGNKDMYRASLNKKSTFFDPTLPLTQNKPEFSKFHVEHSKRQA